MGNFQSSDMKSLAKDVNDIAQDASNKTYVINASSCSTIQSQDIDIDNSVVKCNLLMSEGGSTICNLDSNISTETVANLTTTITNNLSSTLDSTQKNVQGFLAAAMSSQISKQQLEDDITNAISNSISNTTVQSCADTMSINQDQKLVINNSTFICPESGSITLSQDSTQKLAASCIGKSVTQALGSIQSLNTIDQTLTSSQVSKQGIDLGILIVLLLLPFLAAGKGITSLTTIPEDENGKPMWGQYGLKVGFFIGIIYLIIRLAEVGWKALKDKL